MVAWGVAQSVEGDGRAQALPGLHKGVGEVLRLPRLPVSQSYDQVLMLPGRPDCQAHRGLFGNVHSDKFRRLHRRELDGDVAVTSTQSQP